MYTVVIQLVVSGDEGEIPAVMCLSRVEEVAIRETMIFRSSEVP